MLVGSHQGRHSYAAALQAQAAQLGITEQLRIVERFTFDPQKLSLRRDYSVTDPVYLAAPYESYDVMYLSDVPFQKQPCKEMTPEFQQKK